MDSPPPIDGELPFEDETIIERIFGLSEMFPEKLRNAVESTVSKSFSCFKWVFSTSATVTWFVCSTGAILLLPLSIEYERQDYKEKMRMQERNIVLGTDSVPAL